MNPVRDGKNGYQEKLAAILRTDKHTLASLESQLEKITGKVGVFQLIAEENERLVREKLNLLAVGPKPNAHEVYDALISKIESDDVALSKYLNVGKQSFEETAKKVVELINKFHPPRAGFFLKLEKARQLLIAEPPKKVMTALGYNYIEEMLKKEDLLEIYSAIRFLEDPAWQNTVFFKHYETLHPDDFEERDMEIRVLHPKWARAAEKFVAKKYHNVSHLKELGVIFVIPIFLGISGETLRLVSLLLHYFHEVQYYSDLFLRFKNDHENFPRALIALLRGDVIEQRLPPQTIETERPRFLVVQRYLAKDDENDWRLFEPHINPEAMHWEKAEEEIVALGLKMPGFENGLEFWKGLGSIGDFFMDETNTPILLSFNIVDTVMALVKQKELIKYLYHHQESLWNKIFVAYFSRAKLEEYSKKHILKGWFEI